MSLAIQQCVPFTNAFISMTTNATHAVSSRAMSDLRPTRQWKVRDAHGELTWVIRWSEH